MAQILKVDDIHVYYGSIHAVKGVSFEVNEGEVVTLIGANGAGKSTILNTISGLLHPKMGSVLFEDHDLKGVAPHKIVEHGLAQVPEGRHIFQQMTVEENLQMGAYTQPNSTIEPGIADVYERFPRLKERLREYAMQVSGEYQSQVDIAQNRVMQLLTIVTTIFLPLSLIVGWYGMNFDMPELSWEYGYPVVIVLAVVIVAVLIRYFKRKKWF